METLFGILKIQIIYKFKSYYVVWKLDDSEIPREDNEGLNRTM